MTAVTPLTSRNSRGFNLPQEQLVEPLPYDAGNAARRRRRPVGSAPRSRRAYRRWRSGPAGTRLPSRSTGAALVKPAERDDGVFETRHRGRWGTDRGDRAVARADPEHGPAVRHFIDACDGAGGDDEVPCQRVGDEGPEPDPRGVESGQRERDVSSRNTDCESATPSQSNPLSSTSRHSPPNPSSDSGRRTIPKRGMVATGSAPRAGQTCGRPGFRPPAHSASARLRDHDGAVRQAARDAVPVSQDEGKDPRGEVAVVDGDHREADR
jgi:hypothetical protein